MTSNPIVAKLTFTGSTAVGKLLMEQCASTVKKTSMELGGNAPFIVFDDANLEEAVEAAIASKYRNAGQTCVCANRIYVQESIQDAFVARLTERVKDLKVGDAPQTQIALAGSVYPVNGLMVQASLRYYMRHYAAFEPFGRTDPDDEGVDSWEVPSYGVVDLHAYYDLPLNFDLVGLRLFAHVFNALDTEYIQDATDNSRFNGFDGDHDADDAEVFFGLPRYFNVGLQLQF